MVVTSSQPNVLAVTASLPARSVRELVDYAKANPGKLSYASVGSGSVGHLAMALLSKQAGVRLVHVPYRGGGPAMNDAIAGHVDLLIGSTALAIPQVQAGTIRAVVQTGKARTPTLGTVPTVSESGFPNFEAYAWWGVFAPAGTPGEMITRFAAELAASLREPRIATQLTEGQQVTMALAGSQELRSFLAGQMKTWGAVAREFDIKGE